jgi:hypothetical protein
MLKATATVVDPGAVQMTISLTMTVAHWQQIQKTLADATGNYWPNGVTAGLIRRTLDKALGQVTETHTEEQ